MNKRIIYFISFIFSLSTMACPTFVGSYSCEEVDSFGGAFSYSLDVIQNGNSYTQIQTLDTGESFSESVTADGVTRTVSAVGYSMSTTATCVGDSLVIDIDADVTGQGTTYKYISSAKISKSGNILTEVRDDVVADYSHRFTTTCIEL